MRKRGRPPIPANPATLGEVALYLAYRLTHDPSDRAEGRRTRNRVKIALARQFSPWQYNRPLTPAMRGWIVNRWGVCLPGEITHTFVAAKPATQVSMSMAAIPVIPPGELEAAFETCERQRQGLLLRVAQLEAENQRLNDIIKSRLARATRDGGKR